MTIREVSEERGGSRSYQRREGEYVRPDTPLHVVSWDEARDVPLYTGGGLASKSFYWGGVRGSQFVDGSLWPYSLEIEHEVWGELVPEPFNPYDDTAVAIDVDGTRAGYMSSTAASYVHRHVAALVATGNRVLTPVRFSIVPTHEAEGLQVNAFAAFPTFSRMDRHLPSQSEYLAILNPLWNRLDRQVRRQIAEDGYHLTEDTLAAVVALRELSPTSGLTEHTRVRSVPRGVELFLRAVRREHEKEMRARRLEHRESQKRLRKRERLEAERERKEKREVQLRRIIDLRLQGHSYAAIGRQEGLAADTVSRRLKTAGFKQDLSTLRKRADSEKTG